MIPHEPPSGPMARVMYLFPDVSIHLLKQDHGVLLNVYLVTLIRVWLTISGLVPFIKKHVIILMTVGTLTN